MEKNELREYVAFLQDRFPERTDITEESVMLKIEAEAKRQEVKTSILRGAASPISIKPYLLKRQRQN